MVCLLRLNPRRLGGIFALKLELFGEYKFVVARYAQAIFQPGVADYNFVTIAKEFAAFDSFLCHAEVLQFPVMFYVCGLRRASLLCVKPEFKNWQQNSHKAMRYDIDSHYQYSEAKKVSTVLCGLPRFSLLPKSECYWLCML